MENAIHSKILKRTGIVLLAVGVLDFAWMIYSVISGQTSSLKINVFAILAAIFLLRGSLRAASVVRWVSVFGLFAMAVSLVALPLMQPWDLLITQLRLDPLPLLAGVSFTLACIGLLAWFQKQLGSAPVLAARAAAGRPVRNMWIPAVAGVVLTSTVGLALAQFVGGELGTKAESMAAKAHGNGYRYRVRSLNIKTGNSETSVSAMVTAWNDGEIKQVPVRWVED